MPDTGRLKEAIKVFELFERRSNLLSAISALGASEPSQNSPEALLDRCCEILLRNERYCLIWAGRRDPDGVAITPLAVGVPPGKQAKPDCVRLVEQVLMEMVADNPAAQALDQAKAVVIQDVRELPTGHPLQKIASKTGFRSCASWPLLYKIREYGVFTIHSEEPHGFSGSEMDFLNNVMADVALALYAQETTAKLKLERDFNRDIVDTVQALLISISPCGKIIGLNAEGCRVTGFQEEDVYGRYWGDVLLDVSERKEKQRQLSRVLKGDESLANFTASLPTKEGKRRVINWHASVRPEIERGEVGLVLFGIDVTEQKEANQLLNKTLAKWENIFTAIQDPALIVSRDAVILDANPATFAAARKGRDEVIGHKVCEVLHGGRPKDAICPLEALLATGRNRIQDTELRGLHGHYLLTISALLTADSNSEAAATLLVARDLTEEEIMKAEAMRAAQLAAIGELAAGVAHEINNPINGIINYAQILLDDLGPRGAGDGGGEAADLLRRIIKEGGRISAIVGNLLDFSRSREEIQEPVAPRSLVEETIALIRHQLKKDSIHIAVALPAALPDILCSSQQIRQVLLNVFSNARYALNQRFPGSDPEKRISIQGEAVEMDGSPHVRLTISDQGTGIEHDIMDRLFDPFFSTKPKGEGTGLGLSISHGLIKDNRGHLRIQSEFGKYTSLTIDLPAAAGHGGPHGD